MSWFFETLYIAASVLDFHTTWVKNTLKYIISDVRVCICSVQLSDSVTIKKANISQDSTGKKDFHNFSVHNFGCSKF